jgi:acyl carrier protein
MRTREHPNVDLELRQIFVDAAALKSVEEVTSWTKLEDILDDDSHLYVMSQIEQQFGYVITHAQELKLITVGDVIDYVKLRLKLDGEATTV